jgi:hypothetical protein
MPQNTRVLYKNLWRLGTIIAATTENPQFPAEYTQDDDTTLAWRSTAIAAAQDLDNDLGQAYQYDYVALLGHNISASATVTLYGADDSAFTANVVSDILTHNVANLRFYLAAARTKRYVRIRVLDTTNPNGYIEIGTVILGKYLNLGVPVEAEGHEDGYADATETEVSPSQNIFIVRDAPVLRSKALGWSHVSDSVKASLLLLLEACGAHYAIDFCFDYTAPNTNSVWATLAEAARPQYVSYDNWRWAVEVREHV